MTQADILKSRDFPNLMLASGPGEMALVWVYFPEQDRLSIFLECLMEFGIGSRSTDILDTAQNCSI